MYPASHQTSQEHQLHPSPPSGNPIGTQQALTQNLCFYLMDLMFYSFTPCWGVCVGRELAASWG